MKGTLQRRACTCFSFTASSLWRVPPIEVIGVIDHGTDSEHSLKEIEDLSLHGKGKRVKQSFHGS